MRSTLRAVPATVPDPFFRTSNIRVANPNMLQPSRLLPAKVVSTVCLIGQEFRHAPPSLFRLHCFGHSPCPSSQRRHRSRTNFRASTGSWSRASAWKRTTKTQRSEPGENGSSGDVGRLRPSFPSAGFPSSSEPCRQKPTKETKTRAGFSGMFGVLTDPSDIRLEFLNRRPIFRT